MGFEPTIPAFERMKSVHTLDRAATAIGCSPIFTTNFISAILIHSRSLKDDRNSIECLLNSLRQSSCVFVSVGMHKFENLLFWNLDEVCSNIKVLAEMEQK
jgi:hypothetical protein